MEAHKIVSEAEWLKAREALLEDERAFTHARDALVAKRQALPWVKVEKNYTFETPHGPRTLAELFGPRSQLLTYHFMLGPDWEEGCPGCSFLSDHVDGMLPHLEHHDVTYVAVSRAPLAKIEAFKQRMGWRFPWVSSYGGDFNFDFDVSFSDADKARGKARYNYREQDYVSDELPGISAFYRDEAGQVYHTYSAYARGVELPIATYAMLEFTAKGRNEAHDMNDWMRHHDRYGDSAQTHACCGHDKAGR
ncbi:DUF899 domain-containing protein [Paraburkholderia tropica]|uniref:DUF899 domain-containing protein n=1 Tax=Paraburkholderia tropica TaxID=92647 RepID=UPI0007ECA95A|nr:thioredoxin family protein [Paraburkholderia tropica]MBB2982378.1 putative dithiol-disulfide oxidoreductase (DUF899 family) [Paraburkholderia tropica]OBR50331.1 thioredoxin [Paraburkholderia tropica]